MDVSKLFEPGEIRHLSKDVTIALYKRHMLAQHERAERLQQALAVCGKHLEDCCRSDIDWRAQDESHHAAVKAIAALAGPDTPADSQPDHQDDYPLPADSQTPFEPLSDDDMCEHGYVRDHAPHPAAGLERCPVCDSYPEREQ